MGMGVGVVLVVTVSMSVVMMLLLIVQQVFEDWISDDGLYEFGVASISQSKRQRPTVECLRPPFPTCL